MQGGEYKAVLPPNRRLLIVDDDPDMRADLGDLLQIPARSFDLESADAYDARAHHLRLILADFDGFDAHGVGSGAHAVSMVRRAIIQKRPFAMAFVNFSNPFRQKEIDTVKALWQTDRQLEVVICSEDVDVAWSDIIHSLGEHDRLLFLSKPFQDRQVIQMAHSLTRKWSLRRDRQRMLAHLEQLVEQRTAELTQVNAQLSQAIAERRELNQDIQRTLNAPAELVTLGPTRVFGQCETYDECGGDWWMYYELPDGRLLVALGDVTGHGIPATMIAAAARGAVGAMIDQEPDVTAEQLLDRLNTVVREIGQDRYWMTCITAFIDPEARTLKVANAGHTIPFVIGQKDGKPTCISLISRSNPLGSEEPHHPVREHQLEHGQMIAFYSDGITECANEQGKQFGERRLSRILKRYGAKFPYCSEYATIAMCEEIFKEVESFAGTDGLGDDLTMILWQYLG